MGQYNSKNEEVIIAQAGANQQVEDLRIKISLYGAIIAAVAVCVFLIIFCLCCKRCKKTAHRWFSNQLAQNMNNQIRLQQPTTTVRTDQNVPTKVIFS